MANDKPEKKSAGSWESVFNELCYEVFHKNPLGKQLLKMLEDKFFRAPVAHPSFEPPWAYFNEGRNEMIRSFTMGIQHHLQPPKPPQPKGSKIHGRRNQHLPSSRIQNRSG